MRVAFKVNGTPAEVEVEPRTSLADCLRHRLGLTGTHLGCEHGVCGACTVIVDGDAVRSCLMLAVQAEGAEIVTVEGLSDDAALSPLQTAFRKHHALQCGFCTPGMITTAHALLSAEPDCDEDRIREVLSGNLCRCTGYIPIVAAVLEARAAYRKPPMTIANRYIGAPIERVEDLRFLRGKGIYLDDLSRRRVAARGGAAQLRGAWPHPRDRPGRRAGIAGRASGDHRRRYGRAGAADPDPPAAIARARTVSPAGHRRRQGPLCRRADRGRTGRQPGGCRGRARPDRGRDRAVAGGGRPAHRGKQRDPAVRGSGGNRAIRYSAIRGDAAAGFAKAEYTRRECFSVQRHMALTLEPRGVMAEWDAAAGRLTVSGAANRCPVYDISPEKNVKVRKHG